ncbi:MAG: hypothetical protein JOZ27_00170 [Caulobacteraceae bacterium]|nr:hypothetical protein [Caulobacteraceae bacterium]
MRDQTEREKEILARLMPFPGAPSVSGFFNPDDHRVLLKLQREGRVRCWPGDGIDRGGLLACLPAKSPRASGPPGGEAA